MTTAEGASLVKPSLDFNADVAITSPTIAITRKSQPFMISTESIPDFLSYLYGSELVIDAILEAFNFLSYLYGSERLVWDNWQKFMFLSYLYGSEQTLPFGQPKC